MTEFDFDELDKAVNSIMSGTDTSKRNPALDDPADTVVQLDGTAAVPPTTSVVSSVAPPSRVSTPVVAATTQPLATKRRGQFMDIVHPTATMRPVQRVNRQAPSIQPISEPTTTAPSQLATSDMPATSAVATSSPVLPFDMESTAPVAAAPADMPVVAPSYVEVPDTLTERASSSDLASSTVQSDELPNADDELMISEQLEQDLAKTSIDNAPLTTPFLADAKVDKRPLGEPVTMTVPELTSPAPAVPPITTADTGEMELTSEALTSPVEVPSKELTPKAVAAEGAPAQVTTAQPSTTASVVVPAGGSIVQQYDETQSTGPQTSAPIYDTENYHQPIEEQKLEEKHGSAIKWVVWIFILLFIGAAVGAAYYYFTRS